MTILDKPRRTYLDKGLGREVDILVQVRSKLSLATRVVSKGLGVTLGSGRIRSTAPTASLKLRARLRSGHMGAAHLGRVVGVRSSRMVG